MITFLELGNLGRLGNQLFQYAALKGIALKKGYNYKIPDINNKIWHNQTCLLKYFNISADILNVDDIKKIKNTFIEPRKYYGDFCHDIESINDFTNISGFFQNTKYFFDFKNEILEDLTFKIEIINEQEKYLNSLRKDNYLLVSLHIRTGDQIDGTNEMYNKFYGNSLFDKNSVFGNYIDKCLDFYHNKKVKFLVFVGGSRTGNDINDINWAKNIFIDSKFIVNDSNDPIIDMARISLCDDNIISFLSTYSWWAAYLNKNKNKKVFCPKNYNFFDKTYHGFYPEDWIQI